jgi:cell division cycle 14
MAAPKPIIDIREVIPERIYWAAVDKDLPVDTSGVHYFSIDDELVYEPLNADFGPLNLAMVYWYCKRLESKLLDPALADKRIVHCCRARDPQKRANAACLVCAYQVVSLGKTAEEAYAPFVNISPPFLPFRDASNGPCDFHLAILDCLKGLQMAMELGWFDLNKFDVQEYSHYEKVENGDLSWIIPDKFIAFAGPCATSIDSEGYPVKTPEEYVPMFHRGGVKLVVRLNAKEYDKRRFTEQGIKHADLCFADGSCPPAEIISKFLHLAEHQTDAIAVHCKAGLGRTGTLIGLYAMKHYHFPARAFIGWSRICRPGAILGPQQQFLVDMEPAMFQAGAALRLPAACFSDTDAEREHLQLDDRLSLRVRSLAEEYEDKGQGERLCSAKRINVSSRKVEPKEEVEVLTPISCSRCGELSAFGGSTCRCCKCQPCRKEQFMKNLSWAVTSCMDVVIEKTEDLPISPCLKSYWRINKRLLECLPNLS